MTAPDDLTPESEALLESIALRSISAAGMRARLAAIEAAAVARDREGLVEVANIMRRHTHTERWAMTAYAGADPTEDCLLCRALVAAGVLTLDEIGAGTRHLLALDAPRG